MVLDALTASAPHAAGSAAEKGVHQASLAAALDAANALGRSALWFEDRCTWLHDRVASTEGGVTKVVSERVFPHLYDGQMGIALFLAELWDAAKDPVAADLCRAALRHIQDILGRKTSRYSGGFYVGWPGIGFAVWRCGLLLEDSELIDLGLAVLRKAAAEPILPKDPLDLLSGAAGAILLALYLHEELDDELWLAWARRAGSALIEGAHRTNGEASWPLRPGLPGLLGLSHGSSGMLLALLRLRNSCSRSVPSSFIEDALAYERRHYDSRHGNWPDLRPDHSGRGGANWMMAWCHGAPGALLARNALLPIVPDQLWRDEHRAAVRAIEGDIDERTKQPGNLSYCHGLAGNAEALLIATGQLQSWDTSDSPVSSWLVAQFGAAESRLLDRDVRDECHGALGFSPSLFLGLAGIGYFFLRLATRGRVPCVLLPPGCCVS